MTRSCISSAGAAHYLYQETKFLEDCEASAVRHFDLAADDSSKYVSGSVFILRNQSSALLGARLCRMTLSSFKHMLPGINTL